ncbi:hypothetical protein D3C73_1210060 [compost metagenome]
MSPAPTTPILVTGRASLRSGAPAGRLERFWTRSRNAYTVERNSSVCMSPARVSHSSSADSAWVMVRLASITSRTLAGAGEALEVLDSTNARPAVTAAAHRPATVSSLASTEFFRSGVTSPEITRAAHASDCSTKSAGSKMASATPSSNACGPVSVRLLLRGFSIITLTAFSGPMRRGRM